MNARRAARLLLLIAFAVALAGWPAIRSAHPAEAALVQVPVALGDWQFTYDLPPADADGDYLVVVHYPQNSAAAIRQAAAAMNRHAATLALEQQSIRATIVFTTPLSPAEFRSFVAATGLAPTGSIVRAVQPDGLRVTMGVPPVWSSTAGGQRAIGQARIGQDPLDEATLNRLQSRHPENTLLGVVSTDVLLDNAAFARVRNAPQVFALDILAEVITRQVQAQHRGLDASKIHVQGSQLYWLMEDTGIATRR